MPEKGYRWFIKKCFRIYYNRHADKEYDSAFNKKKESIELIIFKIVKKLWTSDSS